MKTKWQCEICYEVFKTKRELIDHVYREFQELAQDTDTAESQLNELGVKELKY